MKKYFKTVLDKSSGHRQINVWQIVTGASILVLGLAFCIGLLFIATNSAMNPHQRIRWGVLLVGLAFGWLLGIMASPDDTVEQSRFSRFSATAGTFLTGYVLSKIKLDDLQNRPFWKDEEFIVCALLFVGGLLTAALVTYSMREYILMNAEPEEESMAEEHEFDVEPGGVSVLDCCTDLPNTGRLKLRVVAGDGLLYVARTDTTTKLDAEALIKHTPLKSNSTTKISAASLGDKGKRLTLHNAGKKPARVRVAVLAPTTGAPGS